MSPEQALAISTEELEAPDIDWNEDEVIIGPTPQKLGKFIGLFDALRSPDAFVATLPTPSKKRSADGSLKEKSEKALETPNYLRKQEMILDDAKPRLLFHTLPERGLSTLIAELRQYEDEEDDEGMAVLRELEDGQNEQQPAESQEQEAPLEKVKWQKKGLKRSHRRVVMRPSKRMILKKDTGPVILAGTKDLGNEHSVATGIEAAADVACTKPKPKPRSSGKNKPAVVSQNFKSLKLRNSGAKGSSRFGRGRFGKR